MSRLIDADAFRTELMTQGFAVVFKVAPRKKYTLGEIAGMLDKRPTVDAVPVVRCAECKYLDESLAMGGWDGSCRYWNTHSTVYSGFCSFGEKKVTE